ncbi:MAG: PepSY domain-containing protein [Eubacterium sp.]|nr:PepSY domain-containing protein [Eubacterium sp.]
MKQKKLLCAAGLAVFLLSGCASQESKIEYIGAAKAKNVALEAAGMEASQAEFTSVDMSQRSGQDYYQVKFTALGEDYAYDIDALTGVIIDAKVPAGSTRADLDAPDTTGVSEADNDTQADSKNASMLSDEEAKTRALAHAGLTSGEVTFLKSSLDYEDGRKVYDVEFYTADGKEYDYEIDASTGEVVSYDFDAESSIPPASDGSKISAQKAKELALAQVPGATESDIREFETDHEDGHMEYEGKIVYEGMEYEFEIDAYSGAFRSWEAEPLH